jgi:hypothetical protein
MNRPSTDSMFATFSRSKLSDSVFTGVLSFFTTAKYFAILKCYGYFVAVIVVFLFVDTISSHNLSDRNFVIFSLHNMKQI